jgi:hypothetical protein
VQRAPLADLAAAAGTAVLVVLVHLGRVALAETDQTLEATTAVVAAVVHPQ